MHAHLRQFMLAAAFATIAAAATGDDIIDIEAPPIEYSKTQASNRVTTLIEKLASGQIELEYTREHGYLTSLLKELEIADSSQVLVFSKTSLQVRYISRRNPRAIYFNDDTYVGWVRGSSMMEISTFDPQLGAAFYTVDMMPWRAKIKQASYDCLACHSTSMSGGVPGHMVRSVHPHVDGSIDSQASSYITDHTSPFDQRWGGWYVTGRHGDMRHMGNTFLRSGTLDTENNGNLLSLWDEFDAQNYLTPYSDIVALMVLEHQTQMHNTLVQANFSVRKRRFDRTQANVSDSDQEWKIELRLIAERIVNELFFCDEAELTSKVSGSFVFANEFVSRGPKDRLGRSLRDFDLEQRLFKYPCSYLIYSDAFDSLDASLKSEVYRQVAAILEGDKPEERFHHIDADTATAILTILRETKPDFDQFYSSHSQ